MSSFICQMPKIITAISLWEVKNILQTKYGVSLQTLSWGDTLLYASFLDGVRGSEEQEDGNEDEEEIELGTNLEELSVAELLEKALRQESLLSPTGGESEVEEGEEEEKEEEEEEREGVELSEETVLSAALRSRLRGQEFILLEATVSVSVSAGDEEGDSATEENQVEEVRIPPLKLYLPFSTETAH